MLTLARKIGLDETVIAEVERQLLAKNSYITKLSEKCMTKGFHILKGKSPMTALAVILKLAVDVKKKYDEFGIDEEIYYDTMSDIRIWCEKAENKGIKEYMWLRNHLNFELFRLGRLQFQIYPCKNKTLLYNKLPFAYGDNLIYIHIPEGEKLNQDKCEESILKAKEFFSRYFPEYSYDYYFCESWLLFEGNREFMAQDSNIVKFMSLFDICYSVKIDVQAIERIYGKHRYFKKNYPENTDLQKRAKAYMLRGNRMGVGVAVRKK
jgi:hypothetical protein